MDTSKVDMVMLVRRVQEFTTVNGRAPSPDETCTLMGWTGQHRHQLLLSAARQAAARQPAARQAAVRQAATPTAPAATAATSPGKVATAKAAAGAGTATLVTTSVTKTRARAATAGGAGRDGRGLLSPRTPGPHPNPSPSPSPVPAREGGGGSWKAIECPPSGERRAAWEWVTARGETPSEAAVVTRIRAVAEARAGKARRRQRRQAVIAATRDQLAVTAIVERDGEQARQWVLDYRTTHGVGPQWGELGRAMGWNTLPWSARQAIIVGLTRRGYLTYQPNVERSLAATLQSH